MIRAGAGRVPAFRHDKNLGAMLKACNLARKLTRNDSTRAFKIFVPRSLDLPSSLRIHFDLGELLQTSQTCQRVQRDCVLALRASGEMKI